MESNIIQQFKEISSTFVPNSLFGKRIATLIGGIAVGQIVSVASSPILTRLYRPEDFGVLAVYTSILCIVGALASLTFHFAIPLPEEDEEAINIFGLSIISIIAVVAITIIAAIYFGSQFVTFIGVPALSQYLWMIPVGVFGLALYETVTQWAIRKKAFGTIARTAISKSFVQTGTQLSAGFASITPLGLMTGQLLGQWTGSGVLLHFSLKESSSIIHRVRPSTMKQAAIRYKKFPLLTAPGVMLNAASIEASPLMLSFFFGSTVTGLFAFGQRVLMIPVSLLSKSAMQVFLAIAPEARRRGRLNIETLKIFSRMLKFGLSPMIILGLASPGLFATVFGAQWKQAGIYTQWLTPWITIAFLGMPIATLTSVLERQGLETIFYLFQLLSRLSAIIIGGNLESAEAAIGLFSAMSAICWFFYLILIFRLAEVRLKNIALLSFEALVQTVPVVFPVVLSNLFFRDNDVAITIATIISGALFLLGIIKSK